MYLVVPAPDLDVPFLCRSFLQAVDTLYRVCVFSLQLLFLPGLRQSMGNRVNRKNRSKYCLIVRISFSRYDDSRFGDTMNSHTRRERPRYSTKEGDISQILSETG